MKTLMQWLRGSLSLLIMSISTVVHALTMVPFVLLKLISPAGALRDWTRRCLAGIAESWISVNSTVIGAQGIHWDVELPPGLSRNGCYLVNCNHQSWVDIVVLQKCFNRELPFLRFFLKQELIWVPVLGAAWWALDFPFMKRASREQVAKKPSLRGKDLENARKACEKFRNIPVSMMNFAEGTRFSERKRDQGGAAYRNLLKPRIGGIGQVLYALGDKLDAMIDVTIVYPSGDGRIQPTFWELVSGQIGTIVVRARALAIPDELRGRNFRKDRAFRKDLENWIEEHWQYKDGLIDQLTQART